MNITRRAALRGTAAMATCAAGGAAVATTTQDAELLALSHQYWALREKAQQLDHSAPGTPRAPSPRSSGAIKPRPGWVF